MFPVYRRSSSICWRAGFLVVNSLSFCLSVKLLISPSYLNEILAGYSNLGCRLFSFITLSMSCHSLLAWRVSIERSAVILMGIPLCVCFCCCFVLFFYFTILYWFCHTSTCIHHGCTCVPHPEPLSYLPPHTIPLGHTSAPAPSFLYPAPNLDWLFISYMILYMF